MSLCLTDSVLHKHYVGSFFVFFLILFHRRDLHTNSLTGYLSESICDVDAFQMYNNLFWCPLPDCCNTTLCGECIARPPSPSPSPTPSQLPAGELNFLWELYNFTNGPNWRNKDNWFFGDPCTERWFGVKCDSDRQHIQRL